MIKRRDQEGVVFVLGIDVCIHNVPFALSLIQLRRALGVGLLNFCDSFDQRGLFRVIRGGILVRGPVHLIFLGIGYSLTDLLQGGKNESVLTAPTERSFEWLFVITGVLLAIALETLWLIELEFLEVYQPEKEDSCAPNGVPDHYWNLKFNHEVGQELCASHHLGAPFG